MQIQAPFCLLIFACSFLEINKRFWVYFLGLLIMDYAPFLKSLTQNSDFGCGFFVIGSSPHAFKIGGLLLVFYLGLKLLQFGFHCRGLVQCFCGISGKSSDKSNGLCSKIDFGEVCDAKIVSCNCGGPLMFLGNSKLMNLEKNIKIEDKDIDDDDDDDDDDERECCNEDQQFDVKELRKMVKTQKQRASVTLMELEKERMAAASAANEAMAMILRLQSEKSAIEIESNHYRRMTEEKQDYDKEVIQSLQWIIKNHESERCQLESKLKLCRQKVKQYVMVDDDDDDDEEFVSSLDPSFSIHDEFVSSLDMDSTEW